MLTDNCITIFYINWSVCLSSWIIMVRKYSKKDADNMKTGSNPDC